jgi:hypothetical protein
MLTNRTIGTVIPEREGVATSPWIAQGLFDHSATLMPTPAERETSQPYYVHVDPNLFKGVRCLLRERYPREVGSSDFAVRLFLPLGGGVTDPGASSPWQMALQILKGLRPERVGELWPHAPSVAEEVELVEFKPTRRRVAKVKVVARRRGAFFRDFDLES